MNNNVYICFSLKKIQQNKKVISEKIHFCKITLQLFVKYINEIILYYKVTKCDRKANNRLNLWIVNLKHWTCLCRLVLLHKTVYLIYLIFRKYRVIVINNVNIDLHKIINIPIVKFHSEQINIMSVHNTIQPVQSDNTNNRTNARSISISLSPTLTQSIYLMVHVFLFYNSKHKGNVSSKVYL